MTFGLNVVIVIFNGPAIRGVRPSSDLRIRVSDLSSDDVAEKGANKIQNREITNINRIV